MELIGSPGKYLRCYTVNHQHLLDNRARDGRVRDGYGAIKSPRERWGGSRSARFDSPNHHLLLGESGPSEGVGTS